MKLKCFLVLSFSIVTQYFVHAQQTDYPKNVILIGWDGVQREHLKQSLEKGELPNLSKLIMEGKIVDIEVQGTTDTKSGWAQILTGYSPGITGVYSNTQYRPIPESYTVFERLKQFLGNDFATIAVISKKNNLGTAPPFKIRLDSQDVKLMDSLKKIPRPARTPQDKQKIKDISSKYSSTNSKGKIVKEKDEYFYEEPGLPYYHSAKHLDTFINSIGSNDSVTRMALKMLDKFYAKRFFMFIHYGDVDSKGHKFGENSEEYNDALISDDKSTGKIIKKLKKLKIYDQTIIYVTSDHGFDEGKKNHANAPHVFLATNDITLKASGTRADITPTILFRLGIDLSKIKPALSGVPLNR